MTPDQRDEGDACGFPGRAVEASSVVRWPRSLRRSRPLQVQRSALQLVPRVVTLSPALELAAAMVAAPGLNCAADSYAPVSAESVNESAVCLVWRA